MTAATVVTAILLALALAWSVLLLLVGRRRRATENLQALGLAQLQTVQQGIVEAIQLFNPDGVLLSRNPAADRIFEMRPDELSREALIAKWDFIRDDHTVMGVEDRPLGIAIRTGRAAERVTIGIRKRADKSVKWLSMSTFPIRGRGDRLLGYVSCAWDITESTATNRELDVLNRASRRLSASLIPGEVVQALTDAAVELSSAPGEPLRRAQLYRVTGLLLTMAGQTDPEGPAETDNHGFSIADHPYMERVIATAEPLVTSLPETGDMGSDPRLARVAAHMRAEGLHNCAWVPLTTREGGVDAILAVSGRQHGLIEPAQLERLRTLAAMAELALYNAESHETVAELARTDPLTGVGNRRALDERFALLGRLRFAMVAVDVDDLKKVNDAHGHQAGDELLVRVAAALAAELRPSDLLARVGGDEFIALLLDCDAAGASELARRLTAAAARVELPWGSASISVGSAAGEGGATPAEIHAAADAALYAAKEARTTLPVWR